MVHRAPAANWATFISVGIFKFRAARSPGGLDNNYLKGDKTNGGGLVLNLMHYKLRLGWIHFRFFLETFITL